MPGTAFFPLHCSVELFSDPQAPAAVTKAKEAAILFDRVIFETGLLDVTMTPRGGNTMWRPAHELTSDALAQSRKPIALGSDFVLAVGVQPAREVPAEDLTPVVSGQVSARYIAEFQSGILDELARHEPEWVEVVEVPGHNLPRDTHQGALRRISISEI